jgi:hypothetical protein
MFDPIARSNIIVTGLIRAVDNTAAASVVVLDTHAPGIDQIWTPKNAALP